MNLSSALLLLTCSFVGVSAAAANAEAAENDTQEESAGVSLRGAADRELWMRPCLHDDCCPYLNGYYCGQGKDVDVNAPGTPDDPTKVYRCDHGEYHAVEHCDGYCKLMPPRTPDKCPHSRPNKYPTPEPPHPTPYPHPAPHPPAPHPTPTPPPPDGTCSDPRKFPANTTGARFASSLSAADGLLFIGAPGIDTAFAVEISKPDEVRSIMGPPSSMFALSGDTDGTTIVVGAPDDNDGEGSCTVYDFDDFQEVNGMSGMGRERRELAHMGSSTTSPARRGASVGVSGDFYICGAPGINKAFLRKVDGSVIMTPYGDVYEIDLSANLVPPVQPGDEFGAANDIEGGLAAIGAPKADGGNGVVYVGYTDPSTMMPQKQWTLTLPYADRGHNCHFGSKISIDEDFIIVGAPGCNKAFVFEPKVVANPSHARNPTYPVDYDYAIYHTLEPHYPKSGDMFGASVDVNKAKHIFLVGAPGKHNAKGAAYLFVSTEYGDKKFKIMPSSLKDGDMFASSVTLDGTSAGIGAPGDPMGMDTGALYIIDDVYTCKHE